MLLTLPGRGDAASAAQATEALEAGEILFLPELAFQVRLEEQGLIDASILNGRTKSVSLDPATGELTGSSLMGPRLATLSSMTARYADFAADLLDRVIPLYTPHLNRRRTSFRPGAVSTRALSARKDDRRLHVDAFPASPVAGKRILRVFTNVDPQGRDRRWKVGQERFDAFAARFANTIHPGYSIARTVLAVVGVTHGRRTAYDQVMLNLHDQAKLDDHWQTEAPTELIAFPPGSTWITYTDATLHAALSGQHAFEQSFLLPVEAMAEQWRSPLRTLERLLGRELV